MSRARWIARWRRTGDGRAASRPARRRAAAADADRGTVSRSRLFGGFDGDAEQASFVHPVRVAALGDDGQQAATPSSVAFCTTRSVASRFSSANTSQRSGSGAWGAQLLVHAKVGAVAPDRLDAGQQFAVAAVEQVDRVAWSAPHDGAEVVRLLRRGGDGFAGGGAARATKRRIDPGMAAGRVAAMRAHTDIVATGWVARLPRPGCRTCCWRAWTGRSAPGCCSCRGCGASCWPGRRPGNRCGWSLLFGVGSLVMRAAGCVVNDLWDRDIDRMVARTAGRPLASGVLRPRQALVFLAVLLAVGLVVLLQLNRLAQVLGVASLLLVAALSVGQAGDVVAAAGDGLHLRLWRADGLCRRRPGGSIWPGRCCTARRCCGTSASTRSMPIRIARTMRWSG